MLRKIAIALVTATMLTAPALAQGGAATKPTTTGSATSAATGVKPTANPTRAARITHKRAKHVRDVRHIRHVKHVEKHARKHVPHARSCISAKHVRHVGMTKQAPSIKSNVQATAPAKLGTKSTVAN